MRIVILRGVSGSGKSSYAQQLAAEQESLLNVAICSADSYFMQDGKYQFDGSKLGEAHRSCFASFVAKVEIGRYNLIIVDNTNTRLWEISPYLQYGLIHAKPDKDSIEVVRCVCDPEEAFERNAHGVTLKNIKRMSQRMENLLPYWPKETIIDTSTRELSKLDQIIEQISEYEMTPADVEAQRRSFAYGNAKLSNPNITRELVDEVAERMKKED